jgi:hypothetical protein
MSATPAYASLDTELRELAEALVENNNPLLKKYA